MFRIFKKNKNSNYYNKYENLYNVPSVKRCFLIAFFRFLTSVLVLIILNFQILEIHVLSFFLFSTLFLVKFFFFALVECSVFIAHRKLESLKIILGFSIFSWKINTTTLLLYNNVYCILNNILPTSKKKTNIVIFLNSHSFLTTVESVLFLHPLHS